jgi:FkbM family methyltransferase
MRLSSVPHKLALALRLARSRAITVGGSSYRSRGYTLNPLWLSVGVKEREPWLDGVLRAALSCGDGVFIDVGANIGQTMLKLLSIDRGREYLGFEPQVTCSSVMQKFIHDNDLMHHTILPIGLSDETKVVKLFTGEAEFDSAASVVESFRPDNFYRGHQYVCLRRGDDVAAELELKDIAVIKVDVEGAELEVIAGLTNTLQQHRPFIIFEVLNFFLTLTNESLPESIVRFRRERIGALEDKLRGLGYEIHRITHAGLVEVAKIEPEFTADQTQSNYVAVPPRRRERFLAQFRSQQTAAETPGGTIGAERGQLSAWFAS